MRIIKGKNANELFINIAKEFERESHINSPRGLKTKEICDAWLELENPLESVVTIPERDINMKYLEAEIAWYLSGSLEVKDIGKHSKFWFKLADPDGRINSNYGFLTMVEKHAGKSQLDWCIDSLKKDKNTRQAIINYNQPRHKYEGVKDFVCTISQQFIVRDNKLDSIVLMRSNDFIYGLSYDLPWFSKLQEIVSKQTGIPIGKYYHYDTSLHVYERHFDMVSNIAKAKMP